MREILLAVMMAARYLAGEIKRLAIFLLMLPVVPLGDFLTVLSAPDGNFPRVVVHLAGTVIPLVLGIHLIRRMPNTTRAVIRRSSQLITQTSTASGPCR